MSKIFLSVLSLGAGVDMKRQNKYLTSIKSNISKEFLMLGEILSEKVIQMKLKACL